MITYNLTDEIFGVFGDTLHIMGTEYNEDKDYDDSMDMFANPSDCLILMPKDVYDELYEIWIGEKRSYCERYDGYCGYGPGFNIKGDKVGTMEVWDGYNNEKKKPKMKEINVYELTDYEQYADLEHG